MKFGKLGKLPPKHDPRTLMLSRYLLPTLPPPPLSVDFAAAIPSWPMYENDQIGDCTCAAVGHMIEAWSRAASRVCTIIPNSAVLKAYEDIAGYVPGDDSTDAGANELDVLNYWRKTGVGDHHISAFVGVDPKNINHVKQAMFLFGGLYIGLDLPASAQDQNIWDVPPEGPIGDGEVGSWGGHAVNAVRYDAAGPTVVTWGMLVRMTWAFWMTYCAEAWAILTPDWIEANGKSPGGFQYSLLQRDLILVELPPSMNT